MLDSLLHFFGEQHVAINSDAVDIVADTAANGGGWRVLAACDLEKDTLLATIPKTACLSVLTTSIAEKLEEQELGGGLALTIAVMTEIARESKSPWHGYLKSLPDCPPLPVFWPQSDLALLKGTEIATAAGDVLVDMKDDYETHVAPFIDMYACVLPKRSSLSFQHFCRAASLVSSRAFYVDSDHGDAMVPFADIFNHRSAVLVLGKGITIEGYADHDDEEKDEEMKINSDDDEEEDGNHMEDVDDENADSALRQRMLAAPAHTRYPLNIAICNKDATKKSPSALEIVLMHATGAHKEIFNTYGELSNGALLMKYGFASEDNPHSIVNLSMDTVLECISDAAQSMELSSIDPVARAHSLLEIDGLFDDENVFEINNQDFSIPNSLLFLVHSALGTDDPKHLKNVDKDPVKVARDFECTPQPQIQRARPVHKPNKDGICFIPASRCVAQIIKVRLEAYMPVPSAARAKRPWNNDGNKNADLRVYQDQLAFDRRVLQRCQTLGRNPHRLNAYILRVGEQEILHKVLADTFNIN